MCITQAHARLYENYDRLIDYKHTDNIRPIKCQHTIMFLCIYSSGSFIVKQNNVDKSLVLRHMATH